MAVLVGKNVIPAKRALPKGINQGLRIPLGDEISGAVSRPERLLLNLLITASALPTSSLATMALESSNSTT